MKNAELYKKAALGITAFCAGEKLLHDICIAINNVYDDFDFDEYENLLDAFSDDAGERNWLEDLCTDLRILGSWDKC